MKANVTAIVVPRVTCDFPFSPLTLKEVEGTLDSCQWPWTRRSRIWLPQKNWHPLWSWCCCWNAHHSWWSGPPGSPVAFEMLFGWALAGLTDSFTWTSCHHLPCYLCHWWWTASQICGSRRKSSVRVSSHSWRTVCSWTFQEKSDSHTHTLRIIYSWSLYPEERVPSLSVNLDVKQSEDSSPLNKAYTSRNSLRNLKQ